MSDTRYVVGLDLGQSQEFTALAVLERPATPRDVEPVNAIRHLQRYPLGTPYPKIVTEVVQLMSKSFLQSGHLIVDQTGVGKAVVDLFRQTVLANVLIPVTITGGASALKGSDGHHVPKKDLVGVLQVLLQARRLQVASQLPNAVILARELENFRIKAPAVASNTLEAWREGQDDDLVLAVGLACWWVERKQLDLHEFLDGVIAAMPRTKWRPIK